MSAPSQMKQANLPESETKEAYSELASDFAKLREDLSTLKKDMAALSSAGVRDAKETLADGLASTEEQAREAVEAATSELQEIQKQAEKAVRKKTLTAIASALAIGYFLAASRK